MERWRKGAAHRAAAWTVALGLWGAACGTGRHGGGIAFLAVIFTLVAAAMSGGRRR